SSVPAVAKTRAPIHWQYCIQIWPAPPVAA
ncbi:unnamed protein product, partial [Adineta steineri]